MTNIKHNTPNKPDDNLVIGQDGRFEFVGDFSEFKKIEAIIASTVAEAVKEYLNSGRQMPSTTPSAYMGTPTEEHLQIIQSYLNDSSSATDDWFVCCVRASDNLINGSLRRWTLNVLEQMIRVTNGVSFLVDHNWDKLNASVGFVFDGFIYKDSAIPDRQVKGMEDWNKKIIEKEGYVSYYSWVALPTNQDIVEMVKTRRAQFISTGGMLNNMRQLCPLCTEKKGVEVGVWDKDKEGFYICPHTLPGMAWIYEYDDVQVQEMPYVVLDGNYHPVEISFVNAGNLPNAQVLR